MRVQLVDLIVEFLDVAVYAVVATALAAIGTLTELAAMHNLRTGQSTLGLWELVVGGVALYAAVKVLTDFVLPTLRERQGT